jgi:CheY-like chemotaxis protein
VVDESGMARKMITQTLNKRRIKKITEAADANKAITLTQTNQYDLIVSDFNMSE